MENKAIPKQFQNNMGIMSKETFAAIQNIKVLLVGLGGLGGNAANSLIRLGLVHLGVVDFDRFEGTNLNRQMFSKVENVGKYKAGIISNELHKINPNCIVEEYVKRIQDMDKAEIKKYDYIIDAVDDPRTKVFIAELGTELNIPVLHGACAGWYGQVGWILPGNKLLEQMYENDEHGIEQELKNPSFTPAAISALMISEFLKYIQDPENATVNQLLLVDLFDNTIIKTGKTHER